MKTFVTILGLAICSIPAFLIVFLAQLRLLFIRREVVLESGRTILLTGGKMTKCLQLARMFHALGDRVIIAETELYKYSGSRFSNAVDRFILVPEIDGSGKDYRDALQAIVTHEKVDCYIPVASPRSALVDAIAKPALSVKTEVFHFDEEIVRKLDDKHQFTNLCRSFGLSAPESHYIVSRDSILSMAFAPGKKYILKKIEYDPVYRLDLRAIPHPGWEDRVKALPISGSDPWVLQEYIEGREVCTHTTAVAGQVRLYVCSDSSPFQVNYSSLDLPDVRRWVDQFVKKLNATGQISFDFIIEKGGRIVPIECNPRTHSAVTLFHGQSSAARAYSTSEKQDFTYIPDEGSRHTYWIYHELYRMLASRSLRRLWFYMKRIYTGKESVLDMKDPWPFWFNNHISIPYQLLKASANGKKWKRIDFNIGKVVTAGGD